MDEIFEAPADQAAFSFEQDSLLAAIDTVLRFTPEDVLAIRERLLERFHSRNMAEGVREVLTTHR